MGSRVEAPYIPRSMYCGLITNSYERLPGPEHHHQTRHFCNEGREPQIRLRSFLRVPSYDVQLTCPRLTSGHVKIFDPTDAATPAFQTIANETALDLSLALFISAGASYKALAAFARGTGSRNTRDGRPESSPQS